MTRVGNSTFVVGNIFLDTQKYRGNTGPTGPAGNTGPDGISGPTGNTGIGVSYILYVNSDGITIFLTDSTEIYVNGLSGNTFTDFTSTGTDVYYKLSGATGIIPNQSFEIRGSVLGFTGSFKPIKWLGGLTSAYSGNDLIISGVTISGGYALGEFGSGLRSDGNTASVFPVNIFKYEENTAGLTTVHVARVALSQFHQGYETNNTNITESLSTTINTYLGNTANIAFQQHQFSSTDGTIDRQTRTTLFSEYAKVGAITGPKKIFRTEKTYNVDGGVGVPYSPFVYGSCCFCDADGRPRCIDYVNSNLCGTLINGTYSQQSCQDRKTGDCRDVGKCCINNKCQNLDNFTCKRLGGVFTRNQVCSGPSC